MKDCLRLIAILFIAALAVSCGGNSSLDDTEAAVFLTVNIDEYDPEVIVCGSRADVTVTTMTIQSNPKDPNAALSPNQDVVINRWVVTPYRTDGGTVASREYVVDQGILVTAGGTADLSNWRVYPYDYFYEPPLSYLFPENGGIDLETGNQNIRQGLRLTMYGRTVSGKAVATEPIVLQYNFRCN